MSGTFDVVERHDGADRAATPALATIASFATSLRVEALSREVVEKAKTCIIDALFGNFLLESDPRAQAALRTISIDQPGHSAVVVGSRHVAAPADAAFVNAVSTAATDRSDTHPPTATHPGIVVIPAALALADHRHRNGASLLEGVVAGYETMCRLARALVTPELAAIFRPTALVAPTAAAVAAARVLGLAPAQMVAAVSLATQTAAGLNEWAHAGTGEHPFHAGFAARNAVASVLLAQAGVTAAPTILDGQSGLLAGFGARQRAHELTRALGQEFELLSIVHKPAPACFFVQTPCQLAQEVVRRGPIDPDSIASVEIRTTEAAARYPGCDNKGPIDAHQSAIMSIQFSVASVLAARGIFESNWKNFGDPTVNALAARCEVVADERLSTAFPARQGASIRIVSRGGGNVEVAQEDFRSMSRDEVVARFLAFAEPRLGISRAAQVVACIERLELLDDVGALTGLLRLE
ncbi:MAG: MmgE/PrpD family protein [Proteobacteria bacterium]|nr:MmgE/PrpD family protein [Pseudomonadota bacterium]